MSHPYYRVSAARHPRLRKLMLWGGLILLAAELTIAVVLISSFEHQHDGTFRLDPLQKPPTAVSLHSAAHAFASLQPHPGDYFGLPAPHFPFLAQSIGIRGGSASLTIKVSNGGVDQVQVQRIQGSQTASLQRSTNSLGILHLTGLLGGLYQLRSWRTPSLSDTQPTILFLRLGQKISQTLTMQLYRQVSGETQQLDLPALVGSQGYWDTYWTDTSVNPLGVVASQPYGGLAQVSYSGSFTGADQVTAEAGEVDATINCRSAGAGTVTVSIGTAVYTQSGQCVKQTTSSTTSTTSTSTSSSTTSTSTATSTTSQAPGTGGVSP